MNLLWTRGFRFRIYNHHCWKKTDQKQKLDFWRFEYLLQPSYLRIKKIQIYNSRSKIKENFL